MDCRRLPFRRGGDRRFVRALIGLVAADWDEVFSVLWQVLVGVVSAVASADHTSWCPPTIDRFLSATVRRPPKASEAATPKSSCRR